jgi:hypothetical protein
MTAPEITEPPAPPETTTASPASLHQPWRAAVALAELLVGAGAVWLAFYCWSLAPVGVTTVLGDGTRLDSTDYIGHWQAAAIGLGTVAAVLLLDAIRHTVLAVRARPLKSKGANT